MAVQGDVSKLADLKSHFATITFDSGRLYLVVADAGVGEYARRAARRSARFAGHAHV
jgi:NAD(P)-dependent dehydrogenase (short-subunit alcohol dehydrogenase family)